MWAPEQRLFICGESRVSPFSLLPPRGHKLPVCKPSICTGGDSQPQAYTQSHTQTHVQICTVHTDTHSQNQSTCTWTRLCSADTVCHFTSALCTKFPPLQINTSRFHKQRYKRSFEITAAEKRNEARILHN